MRNTLRYILPAVVFTFAHASFADDEGHRARVVEKCGGTHKRVAKGSSLTRPSVKAATTVSAKAIISGASPNYTVTTDSTYPDIAIVTEGTTSLISGDNIDVCKAGEAFYAKFKDDRDMLFVFAQSDSTELARGYNAYYQGYRNFVSGIGMQVDGKDFALETTCGSEKHLLGIANMNSTSKWKAWAAPVLDLWPLGVITHEIGHQWISYLTKPIKGTTDDGKTVDVTLASDPASSNRGHWNELVHTNASIMYGNAWAQVPFTSDKWISTLFPGEFTKLDKYLMGISDGSDIDDSAFVIAAEASNIPKHYARPGNTATGKRVHVSLKEIQRVYGKRSESYPDGSGTKKSYKTGFVLVVPKGKTVSADSLKIVDYFRKGIPTNMNGATDGAITLTTDIKSR